MPTFSRRCGNFDLKIKFNYNKVGVFEKTLLLYRTYKGVYFVYYKKLSIKLIVTIVF